MNCSHCNTQKNAIQLKNGICNDCLDNVSYKPCNVCFYTQPYDNYSKEEWDKPIGTERICEECIMSGKQKRKVVN